MLPSVASPRPTSARSGRHEKATTYLRAGWRDHGGRYRPASRRFTGPRSCREHGRIQSSTVRRSVGTRGWCLFTRVTVGSRQGPLRLAILLDGRHGRVSCPLPGRELVDVRGQRVLVGPPRGAFRWVERAGRARTGEPFRYLELPPDMIDTGTTAGAARSFPRRPRAGSASQRQVGDGLPSRSFSFSNSLSRFTWSVFSPPNSFRHR